jgi:hypothetical protein
MRVGRVTMLLWAGALVAGSMGGCKCGKGGGDSAGGTLDTPPIVITNPEAPALVIDFPPRCRSRDTSLNTFIESTLKVAAQGDYDGFRQLFSMAYTPPSRQEFQRIWEAVEAIKVANVFGFAEVAGGQPAPDKYFLHALVNRRQADRKGRLKLDVVVLVFKETGQWRLGPAPKEVVDLILGADSQPADGPTSAPAR